MAGVSELSGTFSWRPENSHLSARTGGSEPYAALGAPEPEPGDTLSHIQPVLCPARPKLKNRSFFFLQKIFMPLAIGCSSSLTKWVCGHRAI